MLEQKRGGHSRVQERDGRIYRLAVPVLKKKLKIWSCQLSRSRAGTAKKCTEKRDVRAKLLLC